MLHTVIALENLLSQYNISTKDWSHDLGNKTIEELFTEIKEGESELKILDQKLVRLLKVSSIDVKFKLGDQYFQLIEDKQIFLSGIERKRELVTITEKLKQYETPLKGAYRGLEEEIGLKLDKELTFEGETDWEKISPSYPNLFTRYELYNYSIILGEKYIKYIRFSEYQEEEKLLSLFTLKPCD
ncbi:hypothetical protein [Geminocystis sp. NIES-3709]|uniref:hypothetical protein n=1 Tax=Geminocystis sp. NIES-3709 TaxID=1617448 RepID=UPI0005FC4758|nr:hypothetical protein [Geminocystis sp. NIES-3709]BAQ66742.1 hypothetical protein GM3709_3507 [Geminocystis sp. NIES-3709]